MQSISETANSLEEADLRLIRALNSNPKGEHLPIHNLRIAVHGLVHPRIKKDDIAAMLSWLADRVEQDTYERTWCHGYDFDDCKACFFEDTDATDDEIRQWMEETRDDENEWLNEKRHEWLEDEATEWLQRRRA